MTESHGFVEPWEERIALLCQRGAQEPRPPQRGDITSLEGLEPFLGHVVKYTLGITWAYALLDTRGPERIGYDAVGYATYEELWAPEVGCRDALTDEDFLDGMVVRPAHPREYKGIEFSYGQKPPEVMSDDAKTALLKTMRLPRKLRKALNKRPESRTWLERMRVQRAFRQIA